MPEALQSMTVKSPNFAFLSHHDPLLVKYAAQAERYVFEDPNTALIKLRQFVEVLAQQAGAYAGLFSSPDEGLLDLLDRLSTKGVLAHDVAQLFHGIRKAGNKAVHGNAGSQGDALYQLRMARTLAIWFHRSFCKPDFKPSPFIPPPNPKEAECALREELERLRGELAEFRYQSFAEQAAYRQEAETTVKAAYDELAAVLELAGETEEKQREETRRFQLHIEELQAKSVTRAPDEEKVLLIRAKSASEQMALTEADTRRIIDVQLREAGWEADSAELSFKKGARPQKGKDLAIAEWPTAKGPADYVLFSGLTPLAVVEAKRSTKDVPGSIEQAKRYSRGYILQGAEGTGGRGDVGDKCNLLMLGIL